MASPRRSEPTPTSYLLVGPPDLLHDLLLDFEDIGWSASSAGWNAVITTAPGDAGAPAPSWAIEVTLADTTHEDHLTACARHLSGGAG